MNNYLPYLVPWHLSFPNEAIFYRKNVQDIIPSNDYPPKFYSRYSGVHTFCWKDLRVVNPTEESKIDDTRTSDKRVNVASPLQ